MIEKVYVYHQGMTEWAASHPGSGNIAVGETAAEAVELFTKAWADRTPLEFVYEHPPTKRAAAVAGTSGLSELSYYHRLARHFHPDVAAGRTFTADEIMEIVNLEWEKVTNK